MQRGEGVLGPRAPLVIRAREPAGGGGATSFALDLHSLTVEASRVVSYLQDYFTLDADEVFGDGFDRRFEAVFTGLLDPGVVVPEGPASAAGSWALRG